METPDQSKLLKKLSIVAGTPVSCSHHSQNYTRGVVYCKDLLGYTEENLLKKLSDQGVVRGERIGKKIDGILTLTPFLIISFRTQVLPFLLRAAWLRLLVCPYVPFLRRCFPYQFFGHISRNYKGQARGLPAICECYGTTHSPDCTAEVPRCAYCSGPHPASSNSSNRYLFEEIVSCKTVRKLTFAEARDRVLFRCVRSATTFAFVINT